MSDLFLPTLFLVMCLIPQASLPIPVESDVESKATCYRRGFPQPFELALDQQLEIHTFPTDPLDRQFFKILQADTIRWYSDLVNSGTVNILDVTSCYREDHLYSVEVVGLPFSGEGNRLRMFIRVKSDWTKYSSQLGEHLRFVKQYLESDPEKVPLQLEVIDVDEPENPTVLEYFYLAPRSNPTSVD